MIKDAASTAMSTAQDAAQAAMEHDRQQAKAQGGGGIMQGLMGNYSELPVEAIEQQYGMYLMQGERFATGFALLRDKILFTRGPRERRPPSSPSTYPASSGWSLRRAAPASTTPS